LDLSDWILAATLVAVLLYTFETWRMRREMQRGRLASSQPDVDLGIGRLTITPDGNGVEVNFHNVGRGSAFNLVVRLKAGAHTFEERAICSCLEPDGYTHTILGVPDERDIPNYLIEAEYQDQFDNLRYSSVGIQEDAPYARRYWRQAPCRRLLAALLGRR
jgi:hypothetical protein